MIQLELSKKIVEGIHNTLKSYSPEEVSAYTGKIGAGGDKTTKLDLIAENAAIDIIQDCSLPVCLFSEESGMKKFNWKMPGEAYFVVLDPLDGSQNQMRGLEAYGSSAAVGKLREYQRRDLKKHCPIISQVEACATINLVTGKTYWASREFDPEFSELMEKRNKLLSKNTKRCKEILDLEKKLDSADMFLHYGAFRDGERIHASSNENLSSAFGAVRFGYGKSLDQIVSGAPLLSNSRGIDSTVIELAYVADGTYDYFLDMRGLLKINDIAAGLLLVEEAGGTMDGFTGLLGQECWLNDFNRRYYTIAAGNKILRDKVYSVASSIWLVFDELFGKILLNYCLEVDRGKSFFELVNENKQRINKKLRSQDWKVVGISDKGIILSAVSKKRRVILYTVPYFGFHERVGT